MAQRDSISQRSARKTDNESTKDSRPAAIRPRPWWLVFLLLLLINYLVTQTFFGEPSAITIPYTFFKQQVQAGNVTEVTGIGDTIRGTFKNQVTYPPRSEPSADKEKTARAAEEGPPVSSTRFKTQRPVFADPGLEQLLDQKGVVVNALDENGPSWLKLVIGFGPTLLLIAAFVWLTWRAAAAGGGGIFGLGRSRAKRYSEEQPKVTFADVAGIDEAQNELIEIVDFLKNPDKYQRLGGTMPKGVLLVGAPGTGKTLLARAIA